MTREEEIKQSATKIAKEWYCGSEDEFHFEIEKLEEMGRWVDEHPKNPWQDTKKDPPQLKQSIILKSWSGRNTYYESLSTGDLQYIKENPELWPYWMSIPELPKGSEI